MNYNIDTNEVLRYLGCKTADNNTLDMIEQCKQVMYTQATPKFIYRYVELTEGYSLLDGKLKLEGDDIKNHLSGCERCVLMAVTVGSAVENMIRTLQVSNMAMAVTLDSCATAAVEAVCDYVQFEVIAAENKDLYVTSRFSPGYGDMPLSCQNAFLNVLDAPRKIGLTVTESDILVPRKSVTAIVGLTKNKTNVKRSCLTCVMNGRCSFQKVGGCNK